ncbi:hypothetical protein DYB28_007331 [Aphanomyces astaci]|uniref:Uncharacterized protein n=1 Tax=Aphanomyces astaci TaxID=112090 RepID=A0A9X8E3X4_APHAT|nr:hypothetical protein DYB28_007331 [Aphanomyces astaci]
MSRNRFDHYDEEDVDVAKSYINLSVHRDNLKYIKETDLEKAHPSIVHKNLAWHLLQGSPRKDHDCQQDSAPSRALDSLMEAP